MPDPVVQKPADIDLLEQKKPGVSATSDAPVIETKPDAAPDEGITPDNSEDQESPVETTASTEPKKPAKGVQKRLDELTRQREDERRARLRSEQLLADALEALKGINKPKPAQTENDDPEPAEPDSMKYTDQQQYNADYRQYLRNLARWEGRQVVKTESKQREEQEQKRSREEKRRQDLEGHFTREGKAREKYADYDSVAKNPDLPITQVMADAMVQSEYGTDVAYYLGQNPDEAGRISKLSPHGQLMELGYLSAQFRQQAKASVTQISKAPSPIKPLGTASASAPTVTKGEPSMEEYAANRSKQLQAERKPGGRR